MNKFVLYQFFIFNFFPKHSWLRQDDKQRAFKKDDQNTVSLSLSLCSSRFPIRYIPRIFSLSVTRSFGFLAFSQLCCFSVSQPFYPVVKREVRQPNFLHSNKNYLNSDKTLRCAPILLFSQHQGFLHPKNSQSFILSR